MNFVKFSGNVASVFTVLIALTQFLLRREFLVLPNSNTFEKEEKLLRPFSRISDTLSYIDFEYEYLIIFKGLNKKKLSTRNIENIEIRYCFRVLNFIYFSSILDICKCK